MLSLAYADTILYGSGSWWRGLGPLLDLERSRPADLSVTVPPQFDWTVFQRHDALFITRPHFANAIDIVRMARTAGCAVIVDLDDALWHAPPRSPYTLQVPAQIKKDCLEILLFADAILTTTEPLAEQMREMGMKNVFVTQNSLPDRMPWRPVPERTKTVLWRGGPHHHDDVEPYEAAILECLGEPWRFVETGFEEKEPSRVPTLQKTLWSRHGVIGATSITELHAAMVTLAPQVVVVPLLNNDFNLAKSDIAALEAAYCGSLVVAPSMPVWMDEEGSWPHAEMYEPGSPDSLRDALLRAMAAPEWQVRQRVALARDRIDRRHRNRHVADARLHAIRVGCGTA